MRKSFTRLLIMLMAATISLPSFALAQEIRVGLANEPTNLDPAIQAGTAARAVRLLVYRGLFSYNGPDGVLVPELVESWEVADDNVTYTFYLEDATFHDGTPVTAEDVRFTFARLVDPAVGASFRNLFELIESVEAVDDRTVRIVLVQPTAPFIDYLALPEAAVVSAAYVEATGGNWSTSPIGAGPFRFVSYSSGQDMTLERFDGFYNPEYPASDRMVFEFYPDSSLRMNALRNGDVDIIEYVAWQDKPILEADPNINILGGVGPFMGLIFNVREGPFAHPLVRQAVAYAIDRQVVIDTAFSGQGIPIFGMIVPESSLAYAPEFDDYFEYNPDRARELLAEAGYPDGFSATLLSTGQFDFHMNTAIAVQSELAKIGIQLALDLPDWNTRLEKNLAAEYDLLVVGTAGDILDPDYLADYYAGGDVRLNNAPGYDNPEMEELLSLGRSTLDPDARREIYYRIQEIALEDSPLIFLMWRDQSYAASTRLQGFEPLPGFLSFQSGIMLERAYLD